MEQNKQDIEAQKEVLNIAIRERNQDKAKEGRVKLGILQSTYNKTLDEFREHRKYHATHKQKWKKS